MLSTMLISKPLIFLNWIWFWDFVSSQTHAPINTVSMLIHIFDDICIYTKHHRITEETKNKETTDNHNIAARRA